MYGTLNFWNSVFYSLGGNEIESDRCSRLLVRDYRWNLTQDLGSP